MRFAVQLAYPSPSKGARHQKANVNNVRSARIYSRNTRSVCQLSNYPTSHNHTCNISSRRQVCCWSWTCGTCSAERRSLHASTNRLARRHCSPISFSSRSHISPRSCRSMSFLANACPTRHSHYWTTALTTIFSTCDPSCQPRTVECLHHPIFCACHPRVSGTIMPARRGCCLCCLHP